MINIADIKDPNDNQGRTIREINESTPHKFEVDDLVGLENGVQMFIVELTRDCDGTPMYTLGTHERDFYITPDLSYGHVGDRMRLIKDWSKHND